MEAPKSIEKHSSDYKDIVWQDYSLFELGMWVHLFCKRARHRANKEKIEKDLYDAQNYLNMMQSHINELKNLLCK